MGFLCAHVVPVRGRPPACLRRAAVLQVNGVLSFMEAIAIISFITPSFTTTHQPK